VSLQPESRPSLEELVAVRFGTAVAGGRQEAQKTGAQKQGAQERHTSAARREEATEAGGFGFIDELVTRFGRGREAAIPILQAIQAHYRYLPDEALRRVCELTEITPAQLAGTSSFYSQFRRSPVGRHVVRVCHGTACHVAGADQITEELRRHLEIPPGADTDPERRFTVDKVACVGCCSLAPVMMIGEETAGRLTPATARQALDAVERKS
jgi:NADH:ubiquinone oxidoreductase subunit E